MAKANVTATAMTFTLSMLVSQLEGWER